MDPERLGTSAVLVPVSAYIRAHPMRVMMPIRAAEETMLLRVWSTRLNTTRAHRALYE